MHQIRGTLPEQPVRSWRRPGPLSGESADQGRRNFTADASPAVPAQSGRCSVCSLPFPCCSSGLTIGSMAAAFRLNADRDAVVTAEADGAEQLYLSLVAQANASRFSHRTGQRFDTLEAVRKAAKLVRERHMPAERLDGLRNLAIAA